jgi:RimJ/RimL family protein N-acetyltransferase
MSEPLTWRAHDGGEVAGTVCAFLRADHRWFTWFESCREDCYVPLLAAVRADLGRDLLTSVDEADETALARFAGLGFTELRREGNFVIPARADQGAAAIPLGFEVISADAAGESRLRQFDDELRADTPGGDGWNWDPDDFHEETYDSREFEPATYLIGVDLASGRYAGLARIWMRPESAKLGFIAVAAPYRRRGLARALLGRVLAAAAERGQTEVTADVDDTNLASATLLAGFGGRRDGGTAELILRAAGS